MASSRALSLEPMEEVLQALGFERKDVEEKTRVVSPASFRILVLVLIQEPLRRVLEFAGMVLEARRRVGFGLWEAERLSVVAWQVLGSIRKVLEVETTVSSAGADSSFSQQRQRLPWLQPLVLAAAVYELPAAASSAPRPLVVVLRRSFFPWRFFLLVVFFGLPPVPSPVLPIAVA